MKIVLYNSDIMKAKKLIMMSEVGLDSRVNLESLFCILQDYITKMFKDIHLSNFEMRNKHHAIWVFSKNKVTVQQRPYWNTEVYINCRIVKVTPAVVYAKTDVMDKHKNIYFTGVTECCAINYETFKFIRTSEIKVPFKEENVDTTFDFKNGEVEFVKKMKVTMPFVDSSKHLNNARAVFPVAEALSKEETLNIYSKPFELAIKYSKQALLEEEIYFYLGKDFDRINFAYKNNEDQVLELGYIKSI